MIRSPTSLTGYSVIFLFHSSPFGRYNSIVGCNFAKLRTGGLGLDEDDGGFTGSGTGAREGPGLDDDEDAAAGACDGVAGAERLFGFKVKSFGLGCKLPASRDTGALNEKAPSGSVSGTTTWSATTSTSLSENWDSGSHDAGV